MGEMEKKALEVIIIWNNLGVKKRGVHFFFL